MLRPPKGQSSGKEQPERGFADKVNQYWLTEQPCQTNSVQMRPEASTKPHFVLDHVNASVIEYAPVAKLNPKT